MSAREKLFHLIAEVSGDGSRPWCDEARRILDTHRTEVLGEAAGLLQARAAKYPARRIFAAGLRHGALMLAKAAMGKTSPADDTAAAVTEEVTP